MTPKVFANEEEARQCCEYWQRQLRLSDWRVKVSVVRRYDMPPERVADCTFYLKEKFAYIRLLDAGDFNPATEFADRDHEICLVHELMHLHLSPFNPQPDTLEQTMSEVAIESTAQALVLINRGARL